MLLDGFLLSLIEAASQVRSGGAVFVSLLSATVNFD